MVNTLLINFIKNNSFDHVLQFCPVYASHNFTHFFIIFVLS
uniref:Uncharacterized protein n=1 Tax=Methanosarcina thermophila TaxID=2210 RepID=Q9UXR2_METTE|nr:hypothetical protein [Methanosarcina thermophila TM-1]